LGNKGGVGCGIKWNDTTICFLNSHLSAGQNKWGKRITHYQQIVKDLDFKDHLGRDMLHRFHHVVWLGDLNFRVDTMSNPTTEDEFEELATLAREGNLEELKKRDQLARVQASGLCFGDFKEGPLDFTPTYGHFSSLLTDCFVLEYHSTGISLLIDYFVLKYPY
jgi:hypothetical protein